MACRLLFIEYGGLFAAMSRRNHRIPTNVDVIVNARKELTERAKKELHPSRYTVEATAFVFRVKCSIAVAGTLARFARCRLVSSENLRETFYGTRWSIPKNGPFSVCVTRYGFTALNSPSEESSHLQCRRELFLALNCSRVPPCCQV